MIKKLVLPLLLATSIGSTWASNWRSEVASFFSPPNDYAGAIRYLEEGLDTLEEMDKGLAAGLLAYCYYQLKDKDNEYRWLGAYFEQYGGYGMGFEFLPLSSQTEVYKYFRSWLVKYPWIIGMGLLETRPSPDSPPPEKLVIGLEVANNVYYKLTDGVTILKGGLFNRGFNTISIDPRSIFERSGSSRYFLEFKVDDLIVSREIEIEAQLSLFIPQEKPAPESKDTEFRLALFVGDEEIASGRKPYPIEINKEIDTGPPKDSFDPFGPGYERKDSIDNSFPIFAVPLVIAEIVKALTKGGEEDESVPPIETKPQISLLFRKTWEGREVAGRASITFRIKELKFKALDKS